MVWNPSGWTERRWSPPTTCPLRTLPAIARQPAPLEGGPGFGPGRRPAGWIWGHSARPGTRLTAEGVRRQSGVRSKAAPAVGVQAAPSLAAPPAVWHPSGRPIDGGACRPPRAQQAYILLDAGELNAAHALVEAGQQHAGTRVSPVLRAWLHAAEGEVLAALGERDGSLRALDAATHTLPANAQDDALPYLMLDAGHLARWRGHCLARLGDGGAIDDLTNALAVMGEDQDGLLAHTPKDPQGLLALGDLLEIRDAGFSAHRDAEPGGVHDHRQCTQPP